MLGTIILVILILALLGALPTWGHSREWGYGPSGIIVTILIIYVILVLVGRVPL
jgi:hypothetical protein